MIIERPVILSCVLFSAVFISLSAPGLAFAITSDSTNFTSTFTTGGVTYRTDVPGQRPTAMSTLTSYPNDVFRSTFKGATTVYPSLGLDSTISCANLDPTYSSYTNGQAQAFSSFNQDTSASIVTVQTLGLIYIRVNPETGSSSNVMVGFKKGNGPIIEGSGEVNDFLRPFLDAFTSAIGAADWNYNVTTTALPASYNIQCGYTSPSLRWRPAP
jgi:hypothetical protein